MNKKKSIDGNYVIGTPVKEGKRGTGTAWKQEIGTIKNGQKETSFVYSEKKSDFDGFATKSRYKGTKITKSAFNKLK